MGSITETTPKPLLPIAGTPMIERAIRDIASQGADQIIVVTGHLGTQVRGHLGDGSHFGVQIEYVHQDEQLGTGHAMRLASSMVKEEPVLLTFADILTTPENYGGFMREFARGKSAVLAAVRHVEDPWRAAAVYVDSEYNVLRIVEKPPPGTSLTHWAHAGMYCFSPAVFDYVERLKPSPRGEYEITDAVSMMLANQLPCKAFPFTRYWKDLGTPADIEEAESQFS